MNFLPSKYRSNLFIYPALQCNNHGDIPMKRVAGKNDKLLKKSLSRMLITQFICMIILSLSYLPACGGEEGEQPNENPSKVENLYSLYGVEVDISCDKNAHPYGSKPTSIMVKNDGMKRETVHMAAEIMYNDEMILRYEENIGKMAPGETITRSVNYYLPFHIQDGESLDFTATAFVQEDPSEKSIDEEKQHISAADLEITDIRFSNNNPVYGDNLTILATIINNGHDDKMYDCYAIFYSNGLDIGKCEVGNIAVGESVMVSIPWIAMTGNHVITVKIPRNGNGNNLITQQTHNELSKRIDVEDSHNNLSIIVIGIIIGVIFIIGICSFIVEYRNNMFNIKRIIKR